MNSTTIYGTMLHLATISGKNDKQEKLGEAMKDPDFTRVVIAGMNPLITYGIGKRFVYGSGKFGDNEFSQETYDLLDNLAARRLTGNAAKDAIDVHLCSLNKESAELLWMVILKDFKAGFGESSVNKVAKDTLPSFPYQRCSLPKHTKLNKWLWDKGIISQEKADGLFCNLDTELSGDVIMTTRQGSPLPITAFPEIEAAASNTLYGGTQSHGEILVEVDGVIADRQTGNGIINRILSGGEFLPNERPVYRVWDQIPLTAVVRKGKYEVPYAQRLSGLITQLAPLKPHVVAGETKSPAIAVIDTKIVKSLAEAYRHYSALLKEGKEGTIIKTKEAIWKDGTSKEQIKLKLEAPCELEVVGFNDGNGKNAELFGSLICRSSDGLLEVNVSGFSDALRLIIHNDREDWMGAIITVMSNSIMEVSSSNKLCSLFLPRFVERRRDKDVADDLPRIREQFAAAIRAVEDLV